MSITVNGKRYVVGSQRERIPTAQQGKALKDRIASLCDKYRQGYPYATMYASHGYWHLVFAAEAGVSLGELVRHQYQDHQLLWIQQLEDNSHLVVVCSGEDVEDKHVRPDDVDPLFWDSITSHISDFTIVLQGEVPEALDGFVDLEGDRTFVRESPLLQELSHFSGAELKPIDQALTRHQGSSGMRLTAAAVLIAAVIGLVLLMGGDDETAQEEVIDNFAAYRDIFANPSATAVLLDIHHILDAMQFIEGWELSECQYQSGTLACSYQPSATTGYFSTLVKRAKQLGRPVSVSLVDDRASVSFPVQTQENTRPYLITPLDSVIESQRAQLIDGLVPDQINIDVATDHTYWVQQDTTLGKSGTGLYALLVVAQSVRLHPTTLSSVLIKRTGIGVNIDELKLTSVGVRQ